MLIWKLEPKEPLELNLDELSETDQKRLRKIKNLKRQREFLGARAALAELLGETPKIEYSPRGAPFLKSHRGLSISHNNEFAAVMLSPNFRVGLDLEAYRPQMLKLAERYLNKAELNALGAGQDLARLSAYWCAKECLIKLHDAPDLDLRKQIHIAPFPVGHTAASHGFVKLSEKSLRHPLFFKLEKAYCLCFSYH